MKEPKENSKIKLSFIDIEKMLGEAGFRGKSKSWILFYLVFFFYWSIIALQGCVSFRCSTT